MYGMYVCMICKTDSCIALDACKQWNVFINLNDTNNNLHSKCNFRNAQMGIEINRAFTGYYLQDEFIMDSKPQLDFNWAG